MTPKEIWDKVQDWLDIKGDVVMLVYTGAIIYKTLQHGLNPSDAMAYSAAIGALGYSKGSKCKPTNLNGNSGN
jgi:hypothetical protein